MPSITINLGWLILGILAAIVAGGSIAWILAFRRMESTRHFGSTDLVTMVCNLAEFQRHLRREVARVLRRPADLSLILFDLDGLHTVNERHGYKGGDQLLRTFARFLQDRVRASDVVARYRQGDEFAILAPNTTEQMAFQLVERLRSEASHLVAADVEGKSLMPISFCVGIAAFDPKADTTETLLVKAEAALAQAKKIKKYMTGFER